MQVRIETADGLGKIILTVRPGYEDCDNKFVSVTVDDNGYVDYVFNVQALNAAHVTKMVMDICRDNP